MSKVRPRVASPVVLAGVALALSLGAVIALPGTSVVLAPLTLASLFTAVFLLDAFDLALPRGDRIGLEGPLIAAATVVGPPGIVLSLALACRAAGMLVRRRTEIDDWSVEVATTAIGVTAAELVVVPFRGLLNPANNVVLVAVALACAALLAAQVLVSQLFAALRMGRPFRGLVAGNLRLQGPLLGAQVSAAVLLALTYEQMGVWALVLVVVLLLLLRHSYAMLIDVRQTYMNTVEVMVDTAELSDPRRAGHSERTARLAREIAEEIGLSSRDVERLSYAALLHDLDMVGLDPEDVEDEQFSATRQAGRVLAQVGFLSDVTPLLLILDGDTETIQGSSESQRLLAMIVALASDIDARSEGVPVVGEGDIARVAGLVESGVKARVIGATIRLGYPVPAVP